MHKKLLLILRKDLKIDLCGEYLDLEGKKLVRRLRKLLNKEFHNVYSLPDIRRLIKSRRMRMVGKQKQKSQRYSNS